MEKYVVNREIGSGSFGKVFLIESRQTGIQYVIKKIELTRLERKRMLSALKEVEVLSKLKHNNIVRYKESFEEPDKLNIVMEYCENGDLHEKIKEMRLAERHFTEKEILDYFVQISLALAYVHEQNILHRDLKTKNIFLTKGNTIKLGDFGIAKELENSFELAQTCIGSPFYISPEICESKPYNKKSDIWALGCVLYEISTLKYAFVAKNMKTLLNKIVLGAYNPLPVNINIKIKCLIAVMLKPNPKDRPTVVSILEKPFLKDFRRKHDNEERRSSLGRQRSKSGEDVRSATFNRRVFPLSKSNLNLNNVTDLTTPETKYKSQVLVNKNKLRKKLTNIKTNLKIDTKVEESKEVFECASLSKSVEVENGFVPRQGIKSKKVPQVDSEYYNLIAEDVSRKLKEITTKPRDEDTDGILCLNLHCDEKLQSETRKKWAVTTLDKEGLLCILNDVELLTSESETPTQLQLTRNLPARNEHEVSIDDLLRLETSEMIGEILQPIAIERQKNEDEGPFLGMIKKEVEKLEKHYDPTQGIYPVSYLVELTQNCKKILSRGNFSDLNSYIYELELKKAQLEKKIGFQLFIEVYRKINKVLELEFDEMSDKIVDGSRTYVVYKRNNFHSAEYNEVPSLVHQWQQITMMLKEQQEYLPLLWHLAIIFYALKVHELHQLVHFRKPCRISFLTMNSTLEICYFAAWDSRGFIYKLLGEKIEEK